MKRIIVLFIISVSIFSIGCVDSDVTMDIDKNGNADVYIKLLTNKYLANSITESDIEKIKEDYQVDNIEKINDSQRAGYLVTKKIGNLMEKKDLAEGDKTEDLLSINEKNQFFFTTYEVEIKLKDALKDNLKESNNILFDYLASKSNIDFHLSTPYKLIESNATSVEAKDNKTVYNWSYTLGSLKNIYLKFRIINITNILISIGAVLIISITAVFMYRRKNINKKSLL